MFNAKSVSLLVLSTLLLSAGAARAESLDVQAGDVRVTVDSSGDVTVRSSSSSASQSNDQSNDQSDEHSSSDNREPLDRSPNDANSGSNTTQSCSQQSYSYSSQSDSNSTNRTYSTSRCH